MTKIATTHVGSLPRSETITKMIYQIDQGEEVPDFEDEVTQYVDLIVKKQIDCGIDFVSDGETAKLSYATYVKQRLSGFAGDSPRRAPEDLNQFPEFKKALAASGGTPTYTRPQCVGEIKVIDLKPIERDVKNLQVAINNHGGKPFMNAVSPGTVALFHPNVYYPNDTKYLEAIADAMKEEYKLIIDAGFKLQLDCPDLALGRHMIHTEKTDDEFVASANERVEILNHALADVPAEQCRVHVCWGNYEGPHSCDIEMKTMLPTFMKLKPQTILFESSNPRHEHEWQVFVDNKDKIPQDKILAPGVIDSTTNFVEHPELVAQRIKRFTDHFGYARVIAGTDCGFATFAGFGAVHPDITWAKLKSLSEGAKLAAN